ARQPLVRRRRESRQPRRNIPPKRKSILTAGPGTAGSSSFVTLPWRKPKPLAIGGRAVCASVAQTEHPPNPGDGSGSTTRAGGLATEFATATNTKSSPLATQCPAHRSRKPGRQTRGVGVMSRIRPFLTWVTLAVLLLAPALVNATPVLSFNQVDFFQNGGLVIPNSEWGEFDIAYDQGSSLQWINIVANPGTPNARWIVQNHPLLPTGLTGSSQFTSASYFDLGTPRGTPVSSLDVGYAITSAPATGAPTAFDATGSFNIGSAQNIINSGVPSGDTAQGAPDNGNLNWNVPFTGLTANWHTDVPNVTQEENWCGPGAATNSLHWLSDQNNLGLTQTLLQTQTELAANMMNNHDGNWDDAEAQGKEQFISDHGLPLEVHYAGGVKLPNNTPLTWDWIESEMAKGQDVEFMTNTHWVVVGDS